MTILMWGVLAVGVASSAPTVAAQDKDVLAPADSASKAKALIQRGIQALGGERFLKVRDVYCEGRLAQFSSAGIFSGYERVYDYVLLPDKNRTEYSKKRNIIYVNNGDRGWTLDRGGVEDSPAEVGERYLEGLKKDIHHLFRYRLNEEGLIFRYDGTGMADLKRVEWVEVMDRDRRITRIAFDQATGRPLRATYITRDPETRVRTEEVEYFANYHTIGGIETPKQVGRERNGRMNYQVYWETCQYNTGVEESHFTRASLEERWAKLKK